MACHLYDEATKETTSVKLDKYMIILIQQNVHVFENALLQNVAHFVQASMQLS